MFRAFYTEAIYLLVLGPLGPFLKASIDHVHADIVSIMNMLHNAGNVVNSIFSVYPSSITIAML